MVYDEEINDVIQRGKEILSDLAIMTFYKYREMGKLIIEAGYRKGAWRSKHRKRALEEWGCSQRTFSNFVQLGELSEEEFSNAVAKFKSIHDWANQPKQLTEPDFPLLPEGKFRTIVIDPPWPVQKILRVERPIQEEELDYETLTLTQIKEDFGKLIEDAADENGCHVYLWVTHKFLPDAFDIFKSWGVKYQCLLTWVKPTGMTPFSWMYNTEHVLFGRIGNLKLLRNGVKLSFEAPVREHSRKPNIFYEIVMQVSPEPRLDMFSRETHEGFNVWGNEVDKF